MFMNMNMLILSVLIFLPLYQLCLANKSVEIEFIRDYSQKQITHSIVTAFLCWERSNYHSIFNYNIKYELLKVVRTKKVKLKLIYML